MLIDSRQATKAALLICEGLSETVFGIVKQTAEIARATHTHEPSRLCSSQCARRDFEPVEMQF